MQGVADIYSKSQGDNEVKFCKASFKVKFCKVTFKVKFKVKSCKAKLCICMDLARVFRSGSRIRVSFQQGTFPFCR